jgi:taurine dioxygenase
MTPLCLATIDGVPASAPLAVRPLTATIGGEVSGVDLSEPLDGGTVAAIRQALLDRYVLFFRDQHMAPADHLRFAQYFGSIKMGVAERVGDLPGGLNVLDQVAPRDQGTDTWHSDHFFAAEPPMATILRDVQLPGVGGDTCFMSLYAAYDALSPAMQRFLDPLTAVNTPERILARVQDFRIYRGDVRKETPPPMVHPVVRVHPETGRKALWVCGNFTTRIVELDEPESDALLTMLFAHINSPEFQCRFRWEPGSVAFWDNRAVQHCGIPDYNERRVMHRTMIAGDRPVGPMFTAAAGERR